MKFPNPFHPPPAPPGFGTGKTIPKQSASYVVCLVDCSSQDLCTGSRLLSQLVFQWLVPFLSVGYSRPLEKEDFWELPKERTTSAIADNIEKNFYMRCPPEKRPRHMKPFSSASKMASPKRASEEEESGKEENSTPRGDTSSTQTAVGPEPVTSRSWLGRCLGRKSKPQYDESLFLAIIHTFSTRIWTAGILKLLSGK